MTTSNAFGFVPPTTQRSACSSRRCASSPVSPLGSPSLAELMSPEILAFLQIPPTTPHPPTLLPVRFERWVVLPPPEPPPPPLEVTLDLIDLIETVLPSVGYSGETLPGLLGLGKLRLSLPVSMDSGELPTCVVLSFGQTIQAQETAPDLQHMMSCFQTLHPGLVVPTGLGDCPLNKTPGDCSSTSPSWLAEPAGRLIPIILSPRKPYKLWAGPVVGLGLKTQISLAHQAPIFFKNGPGLLLRQSFPPDRDCPQPPSSSTLQRPPPYVQISSLLDLDPASYQRANLSLFWFNPSDVPVVPADMESAWLSSLKVSSSTSSVEISPYHLSVNVLHIIIRRGS